MEQAIKEIEDLRTYLEDLNKAETSAESRREFDLVDRAFGIILTILDRHRRWEAMVNKPLVKTPE